MIPRVIPWFMYTEISEYASLSCSVCPAEVSISADILLFSSAVSIRVDQFVAVVTSLYSASPSRLFAFAVSAETIDFIRFRARFPCHWSHPTLRAPLSSGFTDAYEPSFERTISEAAFTTSSKLTEVADTPLHKIPMKVPAHMTAQRKMPIIRVFFIDCLSFLLQGSEFYV